MAFQAMFRSASRLSIAALSSLGISSEGTKKKKTIVERLHPKRYSTLSFHAVTYLYSDKLAFSGKHIQVYQADKFSNIFCECNTRSLTRTANGGVAYSCLTDKCIKAVDFTREDEVNILEHLGRYNDISAVACSPTGRWAVVDRYPGDPFVVIRDSEGRLVRTISLPENGNNFRLFWGQKDRLYVSDETNHTVTAYSPDGVDVWTVGTGSTGSGEGQLDCPGGVAETQHGSLLVCDTGNQWVVECYTDGHCRDVIIKTDTDASFVPRDLSLKNMEELAVATNNGLLVYETRTEQDTHVHDAIFDLFGMVMDAGFNYRAEAVAAARLFSTDAAGGHHAQHCKKNSNQAVISGRQSVHTAASDSGPAAASGSGGGDGGGGGEPPEKQDRCHVLARLAIQILIDDMTTLFMKGEYAKLREMINIMRKPFQQNAKIMKIIETLNNILSKINSKNKGYYQQKARALFRRLSTQLNNALLFLGDASANRSSGAVIRWAKTFIYTDSEVCPCLQEEFLWRCLDIPQGFSEEQAVDAIVLFLYALSETKLVPGDYYEVDMPGNIRNVRFIDMCSEHQRKIAREMYSKYKNKFSSSDAPTEKQNKRKR